VKKSVYCAGGVLLILVATVLGRIDGGGADVALLVGLGLALLIASADIPTKARVRS
jgi:hypothetical protein